MDTPMTPMGSYPQWEVPGLGGGMVIAAIATVHVLVAHFAVGAGLLMAYTESVIARRPDDLLRDFLRRFGRFIVLFSFVFGALTGVGIWFSIGLVAPRATSVLIHNYVWGWAAEWGLFIIEIAAGYVYFYGFDRLGERRRRIVAWIYALAAWGSLVVINGILTFMLTPGRWLETGGFWDGFFNPTYWSSLVLRTISCLSLAGIFAAIVVNGSRKYDREQARHIINHAAWFLVPLVLMIPASIWWFSQVPPESLRMVMGAAIAMHLFFWFGVAASTLIGFYAFVGLIWHKRYVNMETAILLAAIAFIATGSMEFVREGVRKPYLIYDYLYSTGFTKEETARMNTEGVLAANPWIVPAGLDLSKPSLAMGRAVFQAQCSQCHVIDGFNDVKKLVATWNEDLIRANLRDIHRLKTFMPPLTGTAPEKEALVQYLLTFSREASPSAAGETNITKSVIPTVPVGNAQMNGGAQ